MEERLVEFQMLQKLFKDNGFDLYLVGGTVRDYLLQIPLNDMDAVTDATPQEMKVFLPDANYSFERFGSVTVKTEKKVKFDITTLRSEKSYSDSRHPLEIEFIKDLSIDCLRRDFTVNALYLDSSFEVIDYVGGVKDLKDKVLRMVGNPFIRLKEDPLRILRAFRFCADYGFRIEDELSKAIKANIHELDKLNKEKVVMDMKKIKPSSKPILLSYFEEYNIKHLKDVLE